MILTDRKELGVGILALMRDFKKGDVKIKIKNLLLFALIFLMFNTDVQAVTVDVYQNMESGSTSDLLTPEIMNASSVGGSGMIATWRFKAGSMMWIADSNARALPGEVIVGGTDYNVSGTRSWRFRNREELEYVIVEFASNVNTPVHDRITIACYYTTYQTDRFANNHDNIEYSGLFSPGTITYGVLQTIGNVGDDPPYIRAHSQDTAQSTASPEIIKVIPGKTYWVNLHHDGPAGVCKVAAFDPDNGWARIGDIAVAQSIPGSKVRSYAHFGRCSAHGDWPDNETSTYFDHILIDYTNGTFPLLPDNVHIKNSSNKDNTTHPRLAIYPNLSIGNFIIHVRNIPTALIAGSKLKIYDLSGRVVDELILQDGKFFWDNAPVSNGTYLMRLEGTKNYPCHRLLFMR
jgi:hypothetical protein